MTGCWASQSICEVGVQLAQLVGDRDVTLGVAQADRRGDVQRPTPAAMGARPSRGRPPGALDELAQQQVDLDRIPRARNVPGAVQRDQLTAGRLGKRCSLRVRADEVLVAVDHERWAPHA